MSLFLVWVKLAGTHCMSAYVLRYFNLGIPSTVQSCCSSSHTNSAFLPDSYVLSRILSLIRCDTVKCPHSFLNSSTHALYSTIYVVFVCFVAFPVASQLKQQQQNNKASVEFALMNLRSSQVELLIASANLKHTHTFRQNLHSHTHTHMHSCRRISIYVCM